MAIVGKIYLQSFFKVVNSTMGMVGIAMIFYGFWMLRVWLRDMDWTPQDFDPLAPWFIYTFVCIGLALCLITCLGHISAHSANLFCLSCYMVVMFLLLLSESLVAADILLNSDWEKDLPEDPTGRLHDFKDFVQSNIDTFQWISLLIILAQGVSILLAMALRALGRGVPDYDSDDDYPPARLPLIDPPHPQLPPYVIGEPVFVSKNDPCIATK